MNPGELEVGDIIFFMDASAIPIHVAVYAGMRNNSHYITHAVTGKYNSIITTRLKKDDFPYRVYRCHDMALATQSAIRMRLWEEHRVPFSMEKHELHSVINEDHFCHPSKGGQEQLALAKKFFAPNYYRYIEYASHPEMPYFPKGKNTTGMTCCEAVTAAFNVQKLLMLNLVKSDIQGWVSDHTTKDIFSRIFTKLFGNRKISERYNFYLESIHSIKHYPYGTMDSNATPEESPYLPSLYAWINQDYSIEEFVDYHQKLNQFELPLDSVITAPRALMEHMSTTVKHWKYCGELTLDKTPNPLDELEERAPEEWRAHIEKLFKVASEKRESLVSFYTRTNPLHSNWHSASPAKPLRRSHSFDAGSKIETKSDDEVLPTPNKYQSISFFVTPERTKKAQTFSACSGSASKPIKATCLLKLFNDIAPRHPRHPESNALIDSPTNSHQH